MKTVLYTCACVLSIILFLVSTGYTQIKGNPLMKAQIQQAKIFKSHDNISPALKNLFSNAQQRRMPEASSDPLQSLLQIKDDKVLVDFTVKDNINAAKEELQKMGVVITSNYGRVISGFIPINALSHLKEAGSIRFAKAAYKPGHYSIEKNIFYQCNNTFPSSDSTVIIPVISQGDTAQRSYLARNRFHLTGAGVKVGILSDSYNNLYTADTGIKNGELPGIGNPFNYTKPVQVLKDLDYGGKDEGRAMMEIVHDVAPGAELAFYTAQYSETDFAQGIQYLADTGCKVITDDIYYYDEPFFQDGIIAQSIDIAKKKGVTYFSAAGNLGVRSYESKYRPSNVEPFGKGTGKAHNFRDYGDTAQYAQPLYVATGGNVIIAFQWDQSSFAASGVGSTSDLDIYLTDINGEIVASAVSDNIASGEPVELLAYQNSTSNDTFFLTIVKSAGPDPTRLKYILYGDALFYITPAIPGTLAPTLVGHAKAEGAIATGAAWYINTPAYGRDTALVDYYSSEGGVANFYDINGIRISPLMRKKPNIVAPDGGNTSFFDPYGFGDNAADADFYPNFIGTSAATSHAAGVAALMIEAQKLNTITPDQIRGELLNTASDMDDIHTDGFDKKFDFNTGSGLINAERAVGKVIYPRLYLNDLKLESLCADDSSIHKWRIFNTNPFPVNVTWFVQGSQQTGVFTSRSGNTDFTTIPIAFADTSRHDTVVISWKDNFDSTRFDEEISTGGKCDSTFINANDNITAADKNHAIQKIQSAHVSAINVSEVFPNPFSTIFRLHLSSQNHVTNIELYAADGRKLQSETFYKPNRVIEIDARDYKAGVYLLKVIQGKIVNTFKMIKQ